MARSSPLTTSSPSVAISLSAPADHERKSKTDRLSPALQWQRLEPLSQQCSPDVEAVAGVTGGPGALGSQAMSCISRACGELFQQRSSELQRFAALLMA